MYCKFIIAKAILINIPSLPGDNIEECLDLAFGKGAGGYNTQSPMYTSLIWEGAKEMDVAQIPGDQYSPFPGWVRVSISIHDGKK